MKAIWVIAKKEFKGYFTTPLGYVILGLVAFIFGFMFFQLLAYWYKMSQQASMMGGGRDTSLADGVIKPLYGNVQVIFLFCLPFLTMRLFSEEMKMKTIDLLITAPISLWQIVIGKWLSGVFFVFMLMLVALCGPIALMIAGKPDLGIIFTCNLYLILLGSSFIAIGCFFSSVTESQIMAGVATFLSLLFLLIVSWAGYNVQGLLGEVAKSLSLTEYFNVLSKGVVDLPSIGYFLSLNALFLVMTHRALWSKTIAS